MYDEEEEPETDEDVYDDSGAVGEVELLYGSEAVVEAEL